LSAVENTLDQLQNTVAQHLDTFGGYKQRTAEDLADIQSQLGPIVGTLEALVQNGETRADIAEAANLLKRAKNHQTRARNAAARLAA
jgi:hypothetical protein